MRDLVLHDDTYLCEQSDVTVTDGRGFMLYLLDPPILAVLHEHLGIDVTAFVHVADDADGSIRRDVPDAAEARRRSAAMQRANDAAWRPPADLAQAITALLTALSPPDAVPDALLAACQAASSHRTFDVASITDGTLHQDLRDLLAMVAWSLIRGATKVRLLVRSRGVAPPPCDRVSRSCVLADGR